jgi:hypothetical protein
MGSHRQLGRIGVGFPDTREDQNVLRSYTCFFFSFIWLFGVVQWSFCFWVSLGGLHSHEGRIRIWDLHGRLSMAKSPEAAVKAASASVQTALTAVSHDVTYLPGIDSMYSIGC